MSVPTPGTWLIHVRINLDHVDAEWLLDLPDNSLRLLTGHSGYFYPRIGPNTILVFDDYAPGATATGALHAVLARLQHIFNAYHRGDFPLQQSIVHTAATRRQERPESTWKSLQRLN